MKSKLRCQVFSGRGILCFLSAGIFSLLTVGVVVGQQASQPEEKLTHVLQGMQGNWEQNGTESKSWGMDCSGTIKITRTLWLNTIDEARHSITGTYTREANGD